MIQPSNSFEATALCVAWAIWNKSNESATNTPTSSALVEQIASLGKVLKESME